MNELNNNNENYNNLNETFGADSLSSGADMPMKAPDVPQTDGVQRTYSRIYTPGDDGYTHVTTTTGDVPEPSQNELYGGGGQGFGAPQYGAPYNSSKPPKQPKKRSGAATAVILTCAFVVVALLFGTVGFLFAKGDNLPWNSSYTDAETEENKANQPSDGTSNNDSQKQTATIIKDNGTLANVSAGEIGTLMTKTQVAELVKDSVVEITTEKVVNGNSFYQYVQSGAGSGVIIAKEGYIITNNHVIADASKITVRLTNGNEYVATLIGTDSSSDIAVLKIEPDETLTVAELGSSSSLMLAEDVIVIGNPLGSLGGTITNGIVSALAREITIDGETMTLIQTNAAVNPGNSGGGMFNLYGKLVGIVNAKSSGTDVEGLGFAIPIDTAYETVKQLMEYGYVRGRIDHGLELIDITDLFTAASYHVNAYGVYVYESKYTDDIKSGDRITSMNGCEVSTSADIKTALKDCSVGDTVEVTVARGGKLITVKLTLHEYVPASTGEVNFD